MPETFLKPLKVTNKFEIHIIYNNFFSKILRKRLHVGKSLANVLFKCGNVFYCFVRQSTTATSSKGKA